MPAETLTITRPDDWHLHLRDGELMAAVLAHSAARFGRAMIMPNLSPPVREVAAATAYRAEILRALPADHEFTPLMSLYLTPRTTPQHVATAAAVPFLVGYKLYPAGVTTGAASGVDADNLNALMPTLEAIAKHRLVLQIHGEVSDPTVDVFDREAVFIDRVLTPLVRQLPTLKIVLEHITTEQGIAFVREAGAHVAATITAHHLLHNRNHLFQDGIRPHAYCLPLPKREHHRRALIQAATAGEPCFFLGTDSAPHLRRHKQAACGCAGIYTAHAAIELYAEVFEAADALNQLQAFAAHHGADFYDLPRNQTTLTLKKSPRLIPETYPIGPQDHLVPFRAGETVHWSLS